MWNYRFQTNSIKGVCPNCGFKTLRMFELLDQTPLGQEFGVCDRSNTCSYSNRPTMNDLEKIGDVKHIEVKESTYIPQRFISKTVMQSTFRVYDKNNFVQYLIKTYGRLEAAKAVKRYNVGTGKNNSTIYWSMNHDKNVCNGKKMHYGLDGKRIKELFPKALFIKEDGFYHGIFGSHLVKANSIVKVLESEKSAIIMSILKPEYVWLGVGGANFISRFTPINKTIPYELIPDMDSSGCIAFHKRFKELRKDKFENVTYRDILHGQDLCDVAEGKIDLQYYYNDIFK